MEKKWCPKITAGIFISACLYPQMCLGEEVVLTPELCRQIEGLTPDATYIAGVDTDGNSVAPADLDSPSILPDMIDIPIVMRPNTARTIGSLSDPLTPPITIDTTTTISPNSHKYLGDMPLGTLRWNRRTNEMLYNGQPLDNGWVYKVQMACKKLSEAKP